jgi:hypothetical protein
MLLSSLEMRLTALAELCAQLESESVKTRAKADDALFADIVLLASSDYGVSFAKVAERLDVSAPAVGRWSRRVHLPPAYARSLIINELAQLLKARLAEERRRFPRD